MFICIFDEFLICNELGIKKNNSYFQLENHFNLTVSKHPYKGLCVKQKIFGRWVM